MLSWIFFALAGTFLWAFSNIADKILSTKYLKDSVALTAAFGIPGILLSLMMVLFTGVPEMPLPTLVISTIAGLLVPFGIMLYIKSLSLEEASRVVPLWHLSPVFTLVLAVIFIDEVLSVAKYAAFSLILAGGFLISSRRVGAVFHMSPAVWLMLLSSIIFAIVDVIMKFALTNSPYWDVFLVFYASSAAGELILFCKKTVRLAVRKAMAGISFVILTLLTVLVGLAGFILYFTAVNKGPVTLVSAFIGFQSLFVLLMATILSAKFPLLLEESLEAKTIATKLAAIALMIAGLLLLSQ